MNFGLTYDLREDYLALGYSEEETAEFDRPDTIAALEQALASLGHRVTRIGNIQALTKALAAGQRYEMVFNIAEGLRGVGRESQVPALLDAYDIPYTFSDPVVLGLSLHKGMTKHVIRGLGLPTADFAVVESVEAVDAVQLPFPRFVKPIQEGTGKGITPQNKVLNNADFKSVCRNLLEKYRQPLLVETFLPGREFTVGLVGTGVKAEALGVLEVSLRGEAEKDVYSYVNKEKCEDLVVYSLAEDELAMEAATLSLAAWRGLGCRDGGRVDVRVGADGRVYFLEVNPLAGLHPEHSDLPILCTMLGIPYQELIRRIVESATERLPKK